MPIILASGRLRKENFEFKARLGYIARLCLKIKQSMYTHPISFISHYDYQEILVFFSLPFFFFFFFTVVEHKPEDLGVLGKCFHTDLYPWPYQN